MSRDSVLFTFVVAAALCLVCSVFVSGAYVGLRPFKERNASLEVKRNILAAAGLLEEANKSGDLEQFFADRVQPVIVDLETGKPAEFSADGPLPELGNVSAKDFAAKFSQDGLGKFPGLKTKIAPEDDLAGIREREKFSVSYKLVGPGGELEQVILPINGKGLWSTMYGFVALDPDLQTARGLTFFKDGETPGLGGEINNAKWKATWIGKHVLDADGKVVAEVVKGFVDDATPEKERKVDGLSGATITSRGVTNTLRYWLGPQAFGPYLDTLRKPAPGAA